MVQSCLTYFISYSCGPPCLCPGLPLPGTCTRRSTSPLQGLPWPVVRGKGPIEPQPTSPYMGPKSTKKGSILGIVIAVVGIYSVFGCLEPEGHGRILHAGFQKSGAPNMDPK